MIDETVIRHLYVHVPFCAKKCEYCAFYSEAADGELVNRYVSALIAEMDLVAAELKPRTIFFGGGTPSLLNLRQWEQVLKAMSRLNLTGADEWTVECNPATVSLDKAKLLRDSGVNRISMGAQSFDENLLDRLGRIHGRDMIFKSFDILRRAGFDNINVDLMFAIPGQTLETWRQTLAEAASLGSEHLACYEVIYEEDTPLFAQLQAGKIHVDEDLACAMYDELLTAMASAGLEQYEIANFARRGAAADGEIPQRACAHNVNYWRGGSFHGLGPGATGYVRGVRARNIANTTRYCEELERGQRAIEWSEELPPLARAGEIAAFGLRMTSGWPLEQFEHRTGFDLQTEWKTEINRMVELGYGSLDQDRFSLNAKGLRFADWAGSEFLRT
ncbi:MAG TPA: radical SAM family heme chaperone HemW [Verrucomicrobiae bacterium]|jgi:oxygen-independent coproporphyrinogen-3 oxidase|nr:radical SAM family heme chaperone HemW [Verrucomicrobiae bacterium]